MEEKENKKTNAPARTSTPRARSKSTTKTASKPVTTQKREPKEQVKLTPKEVDPNQYVVVRNGFQGRLVYVSKRSGEKFIWEEFGAEQEMELRELRNARNSYKKFFENNWFMFDDEWVIDYLGVRQFYKHALTIDNFDDLFTKDSKEVAKIVSELSEGQKRSVAYRAKQLIAEEKIDSIKVISALEKSLGLELIER